MATVEVTRRHSPIEKVVLCMDAEEADRLLTAIESSPDWVYEKVFMIAAILKSAIRPVGDATAESVS